MRKEIEMTIDDPGSTSNKPPRLRVANWPVTGLDWNVAIWALLVVVCGAQFLDALDLSMLGVALPSIGRDLNLSAGSLQWVVSGYVLGYGGLLLLGGRVSDLMGRREVFLVAVTLFGVASVVSAFMSSDSALVLLRFIKGASAGFTVPAGLSILTTSFAEGPPRARALGILGACTACGFTLGLVLGGLLTELGWRATLLAPGPVALLLVLAGARVIPRRSRGHVVLGSFDFGGAISITASLLVLVYAIVEAPDRGWLSGATIGTLLAGVLLLALFAFLEHRESNPLVRLGILRSVPLLQANFSGAVLVGSFVSYQFIVTLFLQDSLGWSPIETALSFLPAGLIALTISPRMAPLIQRAGTELVMLVGLTVQFVGYLVLLRVQPSMPYAEFLLAPMVCVGAAFAIGFPAIAAQATADVEDHEQGLASGLVNTSMQIGGALILAVVSAVLVSSRIAVHRQLLPHMIPAIGVIAGATGLGVLVCLARLIVLRREPELAGPATVASTVPDVDQLADQKNALNDNDDSAYQAEVSEDAECVGC
jgi:MFS family permease